MLQITNGYELTKSLTNIVILIISLGSYFNTYNKKWKLFFLLLIIDSLLGAIVHGIVISNIVKTVIWTMLSISFVCSVHMLLNIFVNIKLKYCMYLSIVMSIILLILYYLKYNFLLVFTWYVLLIMIISFYYIIKNNYKNKIYYILAYIAQLIGGILLLCKVNYSYLNYDGIYHLFMALTVLFFYIGVNKNA